MRIWDINPGYLNRQSLLGEHRELHGIVSILTHNKKGYSRHPETLRWQGYGWALALRHRQLAHEMRLRGFTDRSPVRTRSGKDTWPDVYIDEPGRQFLILQEKYRDKEKGRIPLPKNSQQLWSHHKYSVLARNERLYRQLGPQVAAMKKGLAIDELARQLCEALRQPPTAGGLRNALQHMWGHVSEVNPPRNKGDIETWSLKRLAGEIQQRAVAVQDPFLLNSTALGELPVWLAK